MGIYGIPESILINKELTIIKKIIGPIDQKQLKEILKYYKKPSNKKRVEDDLVEKKILEYLEQFAKVKEIEVLTKDLRGQDHEH